MAKEPETYPDYTPYLVTHVWPSMSRLGVVERVPVDDMAPQYAAAALAKLVRWAVHHMQSSVHLTEAGSREEHVRTSALGRALAARAQNLHVGEMEALTGHKPVERNDVAAVILTNLWELVPDYDRGRLMTAAVQAAEDLGGRYRITRAS